MPVTKLDQIAWLLNWRGQDIPYNPVFMAYVIAHPDSIDIYCDESRINTEAKDSLPANTRILPYGTYETDLAKNGKNKRVLLDPKHTTFGTLHALQQVKANIINQDNPIESDKAVKNETELHWMQQAHIKSAKGKIRALHWLDIQLSAGKPVTEKSFADQLEVFYTEEEGYKGLSFNTIAGFAANSSIVHYGTPSDEVRLSEGQLFLIDSGVQYLGGTTDDTRTIIIGEANPLQKKRFTAVLKAHINCAMQIFPKGTEGARLDGITRASLWQEEMDYGHGTGHGVGAFLNVHEGPCGIHRLASKPFQVGNVVSVEPGYYEPGWGGIRCENLYTVVEKSPGWYGFETLTYIPFDLGLVDFALLNGEQKQWLENYHNAILTKVAPLLPEDTANWLKQRLASK
jgi:Xaa-Pro aminopeptidase